jgi:hypothetical protein
VFNRKTVFILGAGASWHYGYPTGEGLVRKVTEMADKLAQLFKDCALKMTRPYPHFVHQGEVDEASDSAIRAPWNRAQERCEDLARRLRAADPLVIDYFLGHNRALQDVGKFLISWVIISSEAQFLVRQVNENHRERLERSPRFADRQGATGFNGEYLNDRWCRFVLHKLASGCETSEKLLDNKINFVTFNYDVSLEHAIYTGLKAMDTFNEQTIEAFMKNNRVIHCYGKIREQVLPPSRPMAFIDFFGTPSTAVQSDEGRRDLEVKRKRLLDEVYEASKNLKVIDPATKADEEENLKIARGIIEKAEIVYILGYGFDENNSERLKLMNGLDQQKKQTIMFTNYGDSNRVNKKASRLLTGDFRTFVPPNEPLRRKPGHRNYIEKSTRNVYDALSLDFDELEDSAI